MNRIGVKPGTARGKKKRRTTICAAETATNCILRTPNVTIPSATLHIVPNSDGHDGVKSLLFFAPKLRNVNNSSEARERERERDKQNLREAGEHPGKDPVDNIPRAGEEQNGEDQSEQRDHILLHPVGRDVPPSSRRLQQPELKKKFTIPKSKKKKPRANQKEKKRRERK
jgi:hypothetical protein